MEKGMAGQRENGEEVEPVAEEGAAPGRATARAASDTGPAAPIPSPAQPVSAPPDAPAVPDTEAVDQQATDTATAPDATSASEGGATESEPGEAAGLSIAPDETAVVPDDWPTGVRKYVYIKGMGNVRWEDLDEDEKREYRERNPRVPLPGKPPPDDGGPMGSEGVDEVIT